MIKLIKSTFYKEAATKKKLQKFIAGAEVLSFGPECVEFEQRFTQWQERKYSIFVNSGSSANLAIIQALLNLKKIEPGDAVGFSAVTWSTNAMPLIQLGLKPVPIDIELDTLNISSRQIENIIKKQKIKMLFLTNLLGLCDDLDEIVGLCKKHNIILIEDNCEALGTVYKRKKLGNFGLASTFSFYVGHHMSTVEGGMVATDNAQLATMLRLVRAHGWDRNLDRDSQTKIQLKHKINSAFYSRYTFYDLGYNLRPTDIAGFLGQTQLEFLPEIIEKRNDNFLYLAPKLYERSDLFFPVRYTHIDFVSSFAIPLVCRSREIRDEMVQRCAGKLEIRPIVGGNIAQQPFFHKHVRKQKYELLNAQIVHDQGFYFGNNPEMTKGELKEILEILSV